MRQQPYVRLAAFYDLLYEEEFYSGYSSFIKKILSENKLTDLLVLDLACGTGRLIRRLAEEGFDVEGADASKGMLNIARRKNKSIKYYQQGFLSLQIPQKYDVITCTFDSINYLVSEKDLNKALENINCQLASNGLFIFDFNTVHKKVSGDIVRDNVVYHNLTKNSYWYVKMEIKCGEKIYNEFHIEKLYSYEEMETALVKNKFKIIAVYSDFKNKIKKIGKETRLFIIAQKLN